MIIIVAPKFSKPPHESACKIHPAYLKLQSRRICMRYSVKYSFGGIFCSELTSVLPRILHGAGAVENTSILVDSNCWHRSSESHTCKSAHSTRSRLPQCLSCQKLNVSELRSIYLVSPVQDPMSVFDMALLARMLTLAQVRCSA